MAVLLPVALGIHDDVVVDRAQLVRPPARADDGQLRLELPAFGQEPAGDAALVLGAHVAQLECDVHLFIPQLS